MANEFVRKKWGTHFDENDLNKDGVMTMEDANIFTDRFIKHHNIKGERAKKLKDDAHALWNSLFLFGCEATERKTYLEIMEKEYIENKAKFVERIDRNVKDAFDLFDENKDGVLSEEELMIVLKCWGIEKLDRVYVQSLPQPKPGFIRKQDFIDTWATFFTNDDPSNIEMERAALIGYQMVEHL